METIFFVEIWKHLHSEGAKGLEEDWDKREPKDSGVRFQDGEGGAGAESMFSNTGRSCQTKIEKAFAFGN